MACVIERKNSCGTACHYFQHAAPFLVACWSLFRTFRSDLPRVVVMRDGLSLGSDRWTRGLLQAMNATVVSETVPRCSIVGSLKDTMAWDPTTPGTRRDLGWTPLSWLVSRDDARELAEIVCPSAVEEDVLRIGILNREHTGRLLESATLVTSLRTAFPMALVEEKYFENVSFPDQAQWMHRMDVVISPHGAQLTNALFLRPCTVVLEIFPMNYYVPGYFSTLVTAVGGLTFVAYPGLPDMDRVFRESHVANFRKAPLNVTITVADVQMMIEARATCLEKSQRPRIANLSAVVGNVLHVSVDVKGEEEEEWFVCTAVLGDRQCLAAGSAVFTFRRMASQNRTVRIFAWLERDEETWIDLRSVDVVLDSLLSCRAHLAVTWPPLLAKVPSPVNFAFQFHGAARDYREHHFCYAALDERRCTPAWPHARSVQSSVSVSTVYNFILSQVHATESVQLDVGAPLSLPPGDHQIVAWYQVNDTVDALAVSYFTVV